MGKRVAGICYIKVDGVQLEVSGGVEAPISATKKEKVMALTGTAGYKETALGPYVKLSAIFDPNFPQDKLRDADDMTVTVEMPNGKVYTLSDAWLEGEPATKADDGTVELEFSGLKGQWQ